ncbi:MAG: SLBB domain-containing protein [Gemmatimonadales bacterium]
MAPSRYTGLAASWLLVLILSLGIGAASAQVPTPAQARQALEARPDLASRLRERIAASGLTPEQVRARLRSAGYPDSLLDNYLTGADTTKRIEPSARVFDAVRTLGVATLPELDSMPADTIAVVADTGARRTIAAPAAPPTLTLFGIDVFRRTSTQFQPLQSGPVDANYRLGPGDVLVLILTGDVELAHTLEVSREGFIVIPQVGQLYVANLKLSQLEDLLYDRLHRVYSGVRRDASATTRFQVTVARLRTSQLYVVGDVARPGSYQVSAAGTVLTALYAAGGPTETGNFRRVEIHRGGTLVDSLDLYDYLLRGNNSHDIRLETGDVIFVPVNGSRITLAGRVTRPAIYELKPGETLRDVIQFAGGFQPDALRRRVQIVRIVPPSARTTDGKDRMVIDLAADQFAAGSVPAFPMMPGDSVTVFAVAPRQRDFVTVTGDVWVSGRIGYSTGMTLSRALQLAGGPKPDFYQGQVLVSRLLPDSTRVQLRTAFRDSTGALMQDMPLEDQDEIQVFSRSDFRPERYVAITGAVRMPGRLPYRDGMTLRDAILQVKGLAEDADLDQAEIARLPAVRTGGELATTVRVPLDSSYLFERAPDGRYLGPPGLPARANGAPEVPLQPYDNVLILRQPGWELQRTVTITGQVRFPGSYSLRTRTERITDLLRRAGGLLPTAYAAGVEFYRPKDRHGRVGIDLPRVLADSNFRDNFILFGGDSIFIPEYNPVVQVAGAVNAPVAVAYARGRDIDYYVAAAGGFARNGDAGRAYVTQPSGKLESVKRRFLFPDYRPDPLPGARVFVPEKVDNPNHNTLSLLTTLASVLASLATITIVAVKK